jgi:nucleotide-binding universal stress UspA family protein
MLTSLPLNWDRILIAIDDSPPSEWAVEVGRQLTRRLSAKVMLVHVVRSVAKEDFSTVQSPEAVERQNGEDLLERTILLFPSPIIAGISLRGGVAADEIDAVAQEWKADLIIMGTRGRGRLAQFVLGSTAEAFIRRSRCPVITVAHEPRMKMEHLVDVVSESVELISGARICDWADGESTGPRPVSKSC